MSRKKNPASEMNVAEKQSLPLAQRLSALITDVSALKDCLGVSVQAINQYKLGVSRPSLENLCKIADFYGISTDYLLGRTEYAAKDVETTKVLEYVGLTENACKYLHALKEESSDCLRIISAMLDNDTFHAILPSIISLKNAKLETDLERFGVRSAKEGWTENGYIVNGFDYCDMLEFRLAQQLNLVISDITDPPIDE